MLNVRRIEDDLTGDIDDELISLDESTRLVTVICIDDEGEDVDGFVTNLSSLIRRNFDLKIIKIKIKNKNKTSIDYQIFMLLERRKIIVISN